MKCKEHSYQLILNQIFLILLTKDELNHSYHAKSSLIDANILYFLQFRIPIPASMAAFKNHPLYAIGTK